MFDLPSYQPSRINTLSLLSPLLPLSRLLANRDDENTFASYITPLVALANADDPFIQSNAAKALGVLCVKEVNKKMIVRSGGPDVFINLLRAAKSDLEVGGLVVWVVVWLWFGWCLLVVGGGFARH